MPATRPLIRRAAALAAAGGAVVLSVRVLSRPRPQTENRLIDWEAVRRTARARSGQRVRLGTDEAERLAARYDVIAAEMVPLMAEVCGTAPAAVPRITVLDRHGFIDVNLEMVQRLLAPVERLRASSPETAITAFGRGLTSRYVGEVLGFMSQRVLGQFDPVLMLPPPPLPARAASAPGPVGRPPSALYLVEPNVELLERNQRAPAEPLRRWLILHEATHAWQFEMHPWLAPYVGSLMNGLLASAADAADPAHAAEAAGAADTADAAGVARAAEAADAADTADAAGATDAAGVARAADAEPSRASGPGLTPAALRRLGGAVAGQLRDIGRLQAVMSVLEGYSNLVMHVVGRDHIEGFDELEAALHRRQAERSLVERLILTVTGISLKLRQYDLGERFAEALLAEGGYALLNRVWEGAETMPTMAELRAPERWISRTRPRGGARRRGAD
jgi:coenzyme F420 biosynthesis associated uncharacterized protein